MQEIRNILVERILSLQFSIERSLHSLRKGHDVSPDPYDLAVSEADTGLEHAIRERNRLLLLSLHAALARMEHGFYGICEECGNPISRKRLLANPATKVCLECKSREERLNS